LFSFLFFSTSGVPRQHHQRAAAGTAWRDVHGVAPHVQREHLAGPRAGDSRLDTAEVEKTKNENKKQKGPDPCGIRASRLRVDGWTLTRPPVPDALGHLRSHWPRVAGHGLHARKRPSRRQARTQHGPQSGQSWLVRWAG
jgi:hypothetical protein